MGARDTFLNQELGAVRDLQRARLLDGPLSIANVGELEGFRDLQRAHRDQRVRRGW